MFTDPAVNPMKLQWLVFFSGSPSRGDWKRVDAASRIVRAALSCNSQCHLVFEDRTCISIEPHFLLGVWTGTEAHYFELIQSIVKGETYPGVLLQGNSSRMALKECLSTLIIQQMPNIDVALDFREDGAMVLGGFGEQRPPSRPTAALCVIGGVRDIHQREHDVLNTICEQLQKPQLSVSLGSKAELTSKCIKAVGEMNRSVHFGNAVSSLLAKTRDPPPHAPSRRPHLHLIVLTPGGLTLSEFVERPGTATMVVDAFIHSHGIYSNTWLSILSLKGESLTIQAPGKCLAEADATDFLKEKLRRNVPRNLEETLRDGKQHLQRALVVDEERPGLQMFDSVASPEDMKVPVVVIFTNNREEREKTLDALGAAGIVFHGQASMGGLGPGLAYANMLHNSALLAPVLKAPLARRPAPKPLQPSCPTVSLSSRVPAHERPKGVRRLAPWATKQPEASPDDTTLSKGQSMSGGPLWQRQWS
ncbi:unnamed protein product [Durusdinium trenchii]|uniref:Uncharacterized protein n=1 Tax=Durusdinium trenchii TaxID=1381693 RepID=A0ABP0MXV8_9DINO